MIKAIYLHNGEYHTETDAIKIADAYKQNPKLIWIDICLEDNEFTAEETYLLTEAFKFHELSVEDCLVPQYYPKTEEFEGYVFGALHGIQLRHDYFENFEDSIYELDIFTGKGFAVTIHAEELFFLETIFGKAKARPQAEFKNMESLLYNIFNKVVSSYELMLDKIDDRMNMLEDDILEKPQTCGMQEILDVKKIILAMRKIAEPQQSAYVFYTRANNNIISKEYLAYFRDIFFQCARLNQAIIMRSQTAISLIEVYMSSVTLRLTEIMKFLTIIATVLMPLLIISGYFGMNVKFPEYDLFGERGAWIFAVTLMVSTIAGFLIYFKKKKWF